MKKTKKLTLILLSGILLLAIVLFFPYSVSAEDGENTDAPISTTGITTTSTNTISAATPAITNTSTKTSLANTTMSPAVTVPPATVLKAFKDWYWLLIVGLGGVIIGSIVMYILFWKNILSTDDTFNDRQGLSQNLIRTQRELDKLRKDYFNLRETSGIYERYKSYVPGLKNEYIQLVSRITTSFPELSETKLKDLFQETGEEYWGIYERNRSLKAILEYFVSEQNSGNALKQECYTLVLQLKEQEPELFQIFNGIIAKADVKLISALKPVLEQIQQQYQKTGISTQIKEEIAQLEKSLESIRDYRYRLIPSRLVEYTKELTKNPASYRENVIREKMVQRIIEFIKEYLKL